MFREGLAGFQLCRSSGWSEQQSAVVRETIGDSQAEREFRSDDGEIDLFAFSERAGGLGIGQVDRHGAGQPGDAGISRRSQDVAAISLRCQPGDECVLARAAAEDQNSHGMNQL
jgi:hypothetical protein